jgi:hypothetical protein
MLGLFGKTAATLKKFGKKALINKGDGGCFAEINKAFYRVSEVMDYLERVSQTYGKLSIRFGYDENDLIPVGLLKEGMQLLSCDLEARRMNFIKVVKRSTEEYSGVFVTGGSDFVPSLSVGSIFTFTLPIQLRDQFNEIVRVS